MPKRWAFKDGEERNSQANSTSLELPVSANAGADAASMEAAHCAEAEYTNGTRAGSTATLTEEPSLEMPSGIDYTGAALVHATALRENCRTPEARSMA